MTTISKLKACKIKYYTIHEGYYDYLWKVVPELMHNEDVVMAMMENGYLLDDYLDSIGLEFDEIDFNL